MKSKTLFNYSSKYEFRAYMSSSLTSFPSLNKEEGDQKRQNIMSLNEKIRDLCDRLSVDLYLPQESSNPASCHDDGLSPDEVYLLDRWRVAEADFLIVNVSELSFGVGQEIELANSMGVPAIVFFEEQKRVSRMLKGAPCIFIPPGYNYEESLITYKNDNIPDLLDKLEDRIYILKDVIKSTPSEDNPVESFGKKLKDLREAKGLSYKDLSERTGFSIKYLRLLEKNITDLRKLGKEKDLNNQTFVNINSDKFSNPGIWVIKIIAYELDIGLNDLIPSLPDVRTQDGVVAFQNACKELDIDVDDFFKLTPGLGFELTSYAAQNRFKTKEEFKDLIKRQLEE